MRSERRGISRLCGDGLNMFIQFLPGRARLEVEVLGEGDPLVVIQTALYADELRPLAAMLAAGGAHRVVHYHRRGYAESEPLTQPSTIEHEVADLRALLEALHLGPVDLLGVSYSAAIALTAASSSPDLVRTLTVLEPPPIDVPSAPEFVAANERLIASRRVNGPLVALDEFMTLVVGADWRVDVERGDPGATAAMERDVPTFFDSDLPALLRWEFGVKEAALIHCPVLHIGGSDSGRWFAEVRRRLHRLLPRMEDAVIAGAGHSLATTHTYEVARIVLDFLSQHRDR